MIGRSIHTPSSRESLSSGVTTDGGTAVAELDPGMDLETVLERYAEEIRRCRYGSFRGVIKDGKIVIFAVEHEWRPQLEKRRERRDPKGEKT